MLDRHALSLATPALKATARLLQRLHLRADHLTLMGFALGLLAALLIALNDSGWALLPLLAGRLCDGLDGALARATAPTDRGAFLDICLDFLFYASVPLAFAWANPEANALAAACLLAAFMGTASSFLSYAVLAEKRGLKSLRYPTKSIYYLGGLTEGTETILCFVAMCVWPAQFSGIAYLFSLLCLLTLAVRLWAGWQNFSVSGVKSDD